MVAMQRDRHKCFIQVREVDHMTAVRRPGESFSNVISKSLVKASDSNKLCAWAGYHLRARMGGQLS